MPLPLRRSMNAALPLYRLYLLRAAFLVIGLAQGFLTWSTILHHPAPFEFWHGVSLALLGALTLLSLLGVRYPVRMLPLMIFEFTWKFIWALAIWLPPYLAHTLDARTADNAMSILAGVVVVPLVLPWGYIWKHYVVAPSDRWR